MSHVFLGLGSNIGDSVRILLRVYEEIFSWQGTFDHKKSSLYRTKAWGNIDQSDFVNGVIGFHTSLSLDQIFFQTQCLEEQYGRSREKEVIWGPRILDVDILAYGQQVLETEKLTIPHPFLHKRTFVLVPWNEIDSDWRHPLEGRTIQEMCDYQSDFLEVQRLDMIKKS